MIVEPMSLNSNQIKAVNWDKGHVLIRAGPGSGKTKVIAHRIAHIIEESKEKHFNILGLAFTDKAVKEMRRRVSTRILDKNRRVNIYTFHSFSIVLLRQHGHLLGIDSDFAILREESERMEILEKAIKTAGMPHQNTECKKELLRTITQLMREGNTTKDAVTVLENKKIDDAVIKGAVYKHYRQIMIENKVLDYDGVLVEMLKLLTDTPVGSIVRRIYKHICVDEFQDTNTIQYEILRNLIDPVNGILFVVADNNQTIYGWNGSNPDIIRSLQDEFNMDTLNLPENYRCPASIVSIANKLIANNPNHSGKNAISHKQDSTDNTVRVKAFDTNKDESEWIAKDISKRTIEDQRNCVILARRRDPLEMIADNLKSHGIQSYLPVRKYEFDSNQIAWLHTMLLLASARQNRKYLDKVCRLFFSLKNIELNTDNIVSKASTEGTDYLHACLYAARKENIDEQTKTFLENTLNHLADRLDVTKFIKDSFEWFDRLLEDAKPESIIKYQEEKDIFNKIIHRVKNEIGFGQVTLNSILQEMNRSSKESPPSENAVMCYTIHTAKGMEFDHVYLIGLVEEELPIWHAIKKGDQSSEMQEERRICFVAITRAQKSLTLTYPRKISSHTKNPSRFLKEMEIQ